MNIKNMKFILSCAFLTLAISASTVVCKASALGVQDNYTRLYGQDRYETSIKVSQAGWADGSDYAVIVSGEEYDDSFCAVPLAKANNAPIILTEKNNINLETLNELKRLQVKHIYLIGGESDISKDVENQLKLQITSDVQRLYGKDKYETSVKIAEKLGGPSKVVLVSDRGYADALSVAPVAAIEGMPILVTDGNILPESVNNYIKSHNITKTYVIGGTGSISNSVSAIMPGSQRLEGQDRYETNANVLNNFSQDFDFNNVYAVSSGDNGEGGFADSLAGSVLAAKNSSPIVLVGDKLQSYTEAFIQSRLLPNSKITVLAGKNNIPDSVVEKFQVASTVLNANDKAYSDDINGNADITGNNISFKSTVSGNLYVEGNNASISNAVINGTIFIDPGKDGVTNLDTVTAKNIVILSGTKNGIHLKNVKADTLIIRSKNSIKVIGEEATKINNTIVNSQAVLQNLSSSDFGSITITGLSIDKSVEFDGGYGKPIAVESSAMIKTSKDTTISELDIVPINAGERVIISGMYNNVEVNGNADLLIDTSTRIISSIDVNSAATIYGNPNASINDIEISPINKEKINLYGNFSGNFIKVNTSAEIDTQLGTCINLIRVDKKALVVNINVPKGAVVYQVKGDAIVTGDGSDKTVITPQDN